MLRHFLWSEAHAEAGQVSIAEGEEDHEDDVPGIMTEHHGQEDSGLNVTEHEERNEHQACDDQDGQPDAVFTGPHTHSSQAPASPVHHVEQEEAGHWDEIIMPTVLLVSNSGLDINSDSGKDANGDCENKAHGKSHHPDLFEDAKH